MGEKVESYSLLCNGQLLYTSIAIYCSFPFPLNWISANYSLPSQEVSQQTQAEEDTLLASPKAFLSTHTHTFHAHIMIAIHWGFQFIIATSLFCCCYSFSRNAIHSHTYYIRCRYKFGSIISNIQHCFLSGRYCGMQPAMTQLSELLLYIHTGTKQKRQTPLFTAVCS